MEWVIGKEYKFVLKKDLSCSSKDSFSHAFPTDNKVFKFTVEQTPSKQLVLKSKVAGGSWSFDIILYYVELQKDYYKPLSAYG